MKPPLPSVPFQHLQVTPPFKHSEAHRQTDDRNRLPRLLRLVPGKVVLCSQEWALPWSRVPERRSLGGTKVTTGFAINRGFGCLTANPASVSPSVKWTAAARVSRPSLSISLMDSGWEVGRGRPGHLAGQPDSAAPPPASRRTRAIPRPSSILRQTSLNSEGASLHARPDGFVERSCGS